MSDIIRDTSTEPSFFRQKDIYNDRQKLRKDALGSKTLTQAWIGHLKDHGIKHFIKYSADLKVEAIFWTYPWCEQMWKRFPDVLGIDNTYKTNRFKMYLFQVTGVTDQKSVVNFGFGLINTEKEEGFMWLSQQLDDLRRSLDVAAPSVIITDKEMALKNALLRVFPQTQQQLCVYHINANINAKIKSRWKEPGNAGNDDDNDDDYSSDDSLVDDDVAARAATQLEAEEGIANTQQPSELSRETMFRA